MIRAVRREGQEAAFVPDRARSRRSARVQALRARRGRAAGAQLPGARRRLRAGLLFGASSRVPGPARRPHRVGLRPRSRSCRSRSSAPLEGLGLAPASSRTRSCRRPGSAGESIAAGVAFTLPALVLLGFELDWTRTLLLSLCGGMLGVLMMIPLRRYLIVKEHGVLTYPEGTASRRGADRGREGRHPGRPHLQGPLRGRRLQALHRGLPAVERASRRSTSRA